MVPSPLWTAEKWLGKRKQSRKQMHAKIYREHVLTASGCVLARIVEARGGASGNECNYDWPAGVTLCPSAIATKFFLDRGSG